MTDPKPQLTDSVTPIPRPPSEDPRVKSVQRSPRLKGQTYVVSVSLRCGGCRSLILLTDGNVFVEAIVGRALAIQCGKCGFKSSYEPLDEAQHGHVMPGEELNRTQRRELEAIGRRGRKRT